MAMDRTLPSFNPGDPFAGATMQIRPVWRSNFREEIDLVSRLADRYAMAAVDVEFPGFLFPTPRHAPESDRYRDMKRSVEGTKIIQLGITLFDGAGFVFPHALTWEFNFSDFDADNDACSPASIRFLRSHGLDLDKCRRDGIDSSEFAALFSERVLRRGRPLNFVFFHGLYDAGYLIKLLNGGAAPLPEAGEGFMLECRRLLRGVYDVKYMARFCTGLREGEMGLEMTARVLGVERPMGAAHHAGSDSLLTAAAFLRMNMLWKRYGLEARVCEGVLFGMETASEKMKMALWEGWTSSASCPSSYPIPWTVVH